MTTTNGFLRLRQIIAPHGLIPVSRSTFYAGIKAGKFPPPHKVGRLSLWAVEDIDALIVRLKQNGAGNSAPTQSRDPVGTAEPV
jgi:prophage regulatory protein